MGVEKDVEPREAGRYWRVNDIVEHFRISRSRIYELMAAGTLVRLKLGPRTTLITDASVRAFEKSLQRDVA